MTILLISSHGDPRNPKLWSGTPHNILESLVASNATQVETMFTLKYKFIDYFLLCIEICFKLERRRSKLRRFVTTTFLWVRLRRKKNNFSHLLFFDIEGNPRILKKSADVFKCYRLMDSTEVQWEDSHLQSGLISVNQIMIRRHEEFKIIQNFDGFFVLTNDTKVSLVNDYGISDSKIRVVRTGLGQPLDAPQLSVNQKFSNSTHLLTIAKGEHWRKGIDILLEVFRRGLLGNQVALTAVLGENYEVQIPPGVRKFGFLSLSELNEKFEKSEIFILPCRFEPYGLVFIEAVRMGIPIIATRYSGLGYEFIKSGWPGVIVDPEVDSIARGIIQTRLQIIPNHDELSKLQYEILNSFSWQKMARDILKEWNLSI